jgi:hypothetical protein
MGRRLDRQRILRRRQPARGQAADEVPLPLSEDADLGYVFAIEHQRRKTALAGREACFTGRPGHLEQIDDLLYQRGLDGAAVGVRVRKVSWRQERPVRIPLPSAGVGSSPVRRAATCRLSHRATPTMPAASDIRGESRDYTSAGRGSPTRPGSPIASRRSTVERRREWREGKHMPTGR